MITSAMWTTRIFAIAGLSYTLLWPGQAFAQTSGNQAGRAAAYQKARGAMAAEDWRGAERIFNELWSKSHTYDVALGLGQVELNLKEYRASAQHLAFGLRNLPPKEKPELEAKALDGLRFVKARVVELQVTVDRTGASVLIDGETIGVSPIEGAVFVDPGPHQIEAQMTGRAPAKQSFDAKAGETKTLSLVFSGLELPFQTDTVPATAGPPKITPVPGVASGLEEQSPPVSDRNTSVQPRTVALWTGVGVTALSAGLSVVFALKGSSAKDDATRAGASLGPKTCPSVENSSTCSDIDRSLSDRESANKIANVSFVVAGVAAIATTVLYVAWPRRRAQSGEHVHVVPIATRDAAGLLFNASF